VLGGVRLSYNIHRLTLFGEVCMSMDTKTFYDTKKQYLHPDIVYKHLYIPDVFYIREMSLSLGVKLNLKYKTVAKFHYGYNTK
jgi:hypothetical protein